MLKKVFLMLKPLRYTVDSPHDIDRDESIFLINVESHEFRFIWIILLTQTLTFLMHFQKNWKISIIRQMT